MILLVHLGYCRNWPSAAASIIPDEIRRLVELIRRTPKQIPKSIYRGAYEQKKLSDHDHNVHDLNAR